MPLCVENNITIIVQNSFPLSIENKKKDKSEVYNFPDQLAKHSSHHMVIKCNRRGFWQTNKMDPNWIKCYLLPALFYLVRVHKRVALVTELF